MVDRANLQPALPAAPSTWEHSFSLPFSFLVRSRELRLDAGHYNPDYLDALRILRESGMQLQPLALITRSIFMPTRFKRVYVDEPNGVPFLQGSHIVQFRPDDVKYLSPISSKNFDKLRINDGWILVTRSGTVGRITMCPPAWNEWAASEHIVRIVPDEELCPAGYLCSFLASSLGQIQMSVNIHGAVVDELTEEQLRRVLVPLPETEEDWALLESIDANMHDSAEQRSQAATLVDGAVDRVRPSPGNRRDLCGFSVSSHHLVHGDARFDAGSFNPFLMDVLDLLDETETVRLGDIARVFMPGRFRRIYVEPEYGVPFLQGSHVVQFQAVGLKHLSRDYPGLDELLIDAGWLLVTRSGTTGRVAICPEEWDGWAATEDIIRVVPDELRISTGYLYTFLTSPLGQIQLKSKVHGAVVDHLTEDHVRNIIVPLPAEEAVREIEYLIGEGIRLKSKAVALAESSIEKLTSRFIKHQ